MSTRSYIAIASVVWVSLILFCVAITTFADPYRMFGTSPVPGLTLLKPRIYQQIGIAKTYQLERISPRTVLLGNSRVEVGFDPRSPVWPASWRPVFNAGLDGRDLFMASRMLDEAIAAGRVSTAIVELDFPDFLTEVEGPTGTRPISDDEKRLLVDRAGMRNSFRRLQFWHDTFETTLTIGALSDSIFTLSDQRPDRSITMTEEGFNPLHQYAAEAKNAGYYEFFEQKRNVYEIQFQYYPRPDFHRLNKIEGFRYLAHVLHTGRTRGVRLIFYIPPYHHDVLAIIQKTQRWREFEDWKRALVLAMADSGSNSRLVDFSGFNTYTMEAVPLKGDTRTQTRWYWEPGHFKSALGDLILKKLIEDKGDFGETLNALTVEAALVRERASASAREWTSLSR